MNANGLARTVAFLIVIPLALTAQLQQRPDRPMLQNWAAPLYWQPTQAEREASSAQAATPATLALGTNALVFVAMTPCRIADTIASQGFTGAFGPPSLVAGATGRIFPIPSNTTCPVPSNAQAYSFSISVVPPAAGGYITAYPAGTAMPLAATLIWGQSLLVSNAAVVAAGVNGWVDVYASANTDLVIDINGYYASPTDLNGNLALGIGALAVNTTGAENTATGVDALGNNTTGASNTANGVNALRYNTGGYSNTASGYGALQDNSTGAQNTASGVNALANNSTGGGNTASGVSALENNTTGSTNTASGASALQNNTIGSYNTASGNFALALNTTGGNNTASGVGTMQNNTTGSGNTAIGAGALQGNTTGINNVAVGSGAAQNVNGANSNNIHIGSPGGSSDNGAIRIGSPGAQTSFFAAGIRGATTGDNDAVPVVIDDNGQLGTVSSSRRFKEEIKDMGDTSSGLLRLRPVTFRYKQPFNDGSKPVQYGLVAEEVAEVYPDLVAHSADGQIETVKYQVLDSMLLNELQKEHRQVRELEARIAALEQMLAGKAPAADAVGQ